MDSMKNMDLEHVPKKRRSKSNFFLDRLTIFAITGIVITELILTNGEDAQTAWLFIPYGTFYIIRIFFIMVREAGSLEDLIESKNRKS